MIRYLDGINWDQIFEVCNTTDQYWTEFCNVINFGITETISQKSETSGRNLSFPISNLTREAIAEKKRMWKRFKQSGSQIHKVAHIQATRRCRHLVYKDRMGYEHKLSSNNANMKQFYRYIKFSLKRPNNIATLHADNTEHVADRDKCSLLNNFFSSVFTIDNGRMPVIRNRTNLSLSDINFTETMIYEALSKLSSSYSSGPDGFPTIFLKKCASQLAKPLCSLFSICFYTGVIPTVWKDAYVVPIFKGKGSASNPSNYRPISLTCTICKVMESCIKQVLLNYLIENSLISSNQHGFLPRKSTLTELIECLNNWTIELE